MTIAWTETAQLAAAWLATYWLHSTLLLGGAWLVGRRLGSRHLPAQETLWKVALVGGLLTATLQLAALELGGSRAPLAGAWALPGPAAAVPASASAAGSPPAGEESALFADDFASTSPALAAGAAIPQLAGSLASDPRDPDGDRLATASRSGLATATAPGAGSAAGAFASHRLATAATWLVALWGVAALLLIARLASAHARLSWRLRRRQPIVEGPVAGRLARLHAAAAMDRPVGLSRTPAIPVPIARGLARSEICLPQRALDELRPRQQECMLAHELGHVDRRDPAWLLISSALEALFFFQPLHRVARARLREIAEYRCDDWAARLTREPLSLARCLTQVAGWTLGPAAAIPAPGIAAGRSGLAQRVRRLLESDGDGESRPRWLLPAAGVVLALMIAAAPGVRPSDAGPLDAGPGTEAAGDAAAQDAEEPGEDDAEAIEAAMEADFARQQEAREAERTAAEHRREHYRHEHEHEAAEQIEEAFEEEMERFEEDLERALEPLEDGLEGRMEAWAEEFEHEMESFSEGFEAEFEAMMEAFEETAEELEWDAESDHEISARFAAAMAELGSRIGIEAAAFAEAFTPMAELGEMMAERFGDDFHQRIQAMVESAVPSHEEMERLGPELERLQADAERLAAESRFEGAEAEELRRRARELAEQLRPTQEELDRIRAEAERIVQESVPSREELDRIRAEQRRAMETWRAEHAEELEKLRADLRVERERLRQLREETHTKVEVERRVQEEERRAIEEERRAERERQREERQREQSEPQR